MQHLTAASRISIHAPTRGATIFQQKTAIIGYDFNPRSYKRSDSIHAFFAVYWQNFNPRSYKRSDRHGTVYLVKDKGFQSTLLQEERPFSLFCQRIFIKFQSTLLQEERQQKCTIILILICNNYCIVSIKSHQHYNNYFM